MGNCPWGDFIGGDCPGGINCSGVISGSKNSGGNCLGGDFLGSNCPGEGGLSWGMSRYHKS